MLRGDKQMFLNQRRVNYPFIGSRLFDLELLPPVARLEKRRGVSRGDKQMFLNQRRVNYPFIGSGSFDLEPLPPVASQRKAEAPVKRRTNLANRG
ncbi:hypothetical protein ACA30_11430 [Virgibacillus soli]|nr:hypothetical protein ACA30_11430 [Virgibacillus soli]